MKKIISALFGVLLVFSLNTSVANAAAKEVRIAFFLEWATPNQEDKVKKAFDKAINNSNKVAMSLSDQFCVERHKTHFLDLVKNKLDITFANEQEITSLIKAKNFGEVIDFSKQLNKLVVVTRGEKGAIAVNGEEVIESGIQKNLKILDLTGAGDLFAAGFLRHMHHFVAHDSLWQSDNNESQNTRELNLLSQSNLAFLVRRHR